MRQFSFIYWLCLAGFTLVLLSPLFYSGAVIFPFVVPKAAAIHIGIALIAVIATLQFYKTKRSPGLSYLSFALLAYLLINLVSALLGLNPEQSLVSSFERSQGSYGLALSVLLCFSAAALWNTENEWRQMFRGIVLATSVITAPALIFFAGFYQVAYFKMDFGRLSFTVDNAAIFGHYLGILTTLALALLLVDFKLASKKLLLLESIAFLLLLLCLLATGTRGGILALVLTTPFIFWASPLSNRLKIVATLSAVMVVSISLYVMRDLILDRLVETTLGSQSIAYRIDAWQIGWQAIWERPWLGWGSDNFLVVFGQFSSAIQIPKETFDTAHNHLIAIAVGSGLIGLMLYILVPCLVLVKMLAIIRGQDEVARGNALLVAVVIIAYQAASIFIFETLIAQPIYYLVIGYGLMQSRSRIKFKPKWNLLSLGTASVLALAVITHEAAIWKSAERLKIVESSPDWTAKIAAASQETGGIRQEELLYLFSMESWQAWTTLSSEEKQLVRTVLDQMLIDSNIETLNWRTTFHLANAYLRMVVEYPDLQKSLRLLVDRTYQLAPLRPQSTRLLANYFIISGQDDRARQVLETYLEKNPDRPLMRGMLERLDP